MNTYTASPATLNGKTYPTGLVAINGTVSPRPCGPATQACLRPQYSWHVVPAKKRSAFRNGSRRRSAGRNYGKGLPNIVIGDLQNVRPFGVQKVHSLPWPAESVRRIYWCEGAFVTHSVIRGEHPSPGKKFLWGSGFPGCVLRSYEKASVRDRPTTQLWFIRQEKEYVRPVSDMVLRYVFRGTWDAQSSLNPQASFASLLLSPRANGAAEKEFAASFLGMAGEACSLLSKTDCTKQVARLAALGDADLRAAACHFLAYEFREECSPQRAPGKEP